MADIRTFSDALDIASSGRGDIPKAERLAAETYLSSLQNSAEGIDFSIYLLSADKSLEMSSACFFWATNTLLYHFNESSRLVDNEKSEAMYHQLFEYIKQYVLTVGQRSQSSTSYANDYILNKHAQLMVAGLQYFFSCDHWNKFLLDLLEMHRQSTGQFFENYVTMYLLRVLEYIDERVVSVRDRVDRTKRQQEVDMEIKDAMRESAVSQFVEIWYSILSQTRSTPPPEMIKLSLELVKLYAEWIDIGLLVNEKWIQLLYYYFSIPAYRVAVCECLLSLVNKKQVPDVKRETLMRLRISEEIPHMIRVLWSLRRAADGRTVLETNASLPPSSYLFPSERLETLEMDETESVDLDAFTDVVTMLCTAVGLQILRLVDTCRTAMLSHQSAVESSESPSSPSRPLDSSSSSSLLLPHADSLLHALRTMVSNLIEMIAARPLDLPISNVVNFLQVYVKSHYFSPQEAEALLDPLFRRTIADGIHKSSYSSVDEMFNEGVLEDRKPIFLIISLIYRRYPDLVYNHLQQIVWCATLRAEQPQVPSFDPTRMKNNIMLGVRNTFSLLQLSGDDEVGAKDGGKLNNNALEPSDAGLLYYFYASAPFLEAALRYVYEIGSSIALEGLRDTQAPLTQVIERILRVGCVCFFTPLIGPDSNDSPPPSCFFNGSLSMDNFSAFSYLYGYGDYATGCSAVHLSFFETIYRYHLFVVYHPEYLQTLMEILLLNPYGVCHPHAKTRTRICSLLRQIVFALLNVSGSTPLLPHAVPMVKALSAVTLMSSSDGVASPRITGNPFHFSLVHFSPSDRRELYETMGMLLSVAAVAGPPNSVSNHSKMNDGTETKISETIGISSAYFQEHLTACYELLQSVGNGLLEQLRATSVQAVRNAPSDREVGEGASQPCWLWSYSSPSSPKSGATSPQVHSSPLPNFREELVAERLSYCTSWAKGLRLGCTNCASTTSEESQTAARIFFLSAFSEGSSRFPEGLDFPNLSDRVSLSAVWQRCISYSLLPMLQTVGPVWRTFQTSSAVREKTGFFFSQLINVMPIYDCSLEEPFTDYLCSSLQHIMSSKWANREVPSLGNSFHKDPSAVENSFHGSSQRAALGVGCANQTVITPTDLIRLLRLLYQLLGTARRQAANTLRSVLPLLWKSIKECVGPLRTLVSSGVESSATIDRKDSFQSSVPDAVPQKSLEEAQGLNFPIKSDQFREAVEVYKNYFLVLINAATFNCSGIFLSLPEGTFEETFDQLTDALLFPAELELPRSSLQFFSRILADSATNCDKATTNFMINTPESDSELLPLHEELRKPIFSVFFPTCLNVFTSPSFDWKDAKNSLLCSDFFYFSHTVVKRYGEDALQHFFSVFSPYVGEENARSLCIQLRDENRVSPGLKNRLRGALQQIQAATHLSFS